MISVFLLVAGVFFLSAGSVGILRFPDLYSRMHASGKCDTLGVVLSLVGMVTYLGWSMVAVKLLFIALFIFLANPTATHAIARAAFRKGIEPWRRG